MTDKRSETKRFTAMFCRAWVKTLKDIKKNHPEWLPGAKSKPKDETTPA